MDVTWILIELFYTNWPITFRHYYAKQIFLTLFIQLIFLIFVVSKNTEFLVKSNYLYIPRQKWDTENFSNTS